MKLDMSDEKRIDDQSDLSMLCVCMGVFVFVVCSGALWLC